MLRKKFFTSLFKGVNHLCRINKEIILLYQQKYMQNSDSKDRSGQHKNSMASFVIQGIIYEIILMALYGVYVKVKPDVASFHNQSYYPMYQDVNVMMLIGFGYLMVFIKTHAWSALTYTFFINAFVVQQYILWQQFWHKAFKNAWSEQIYITETSFTGASYCVASMLIAFGAVIGKVDFSTLLPLANFGTLFYTLNEALCYEVLGVKDSGGSTVIHTFGAYFGLTMTLLVSYKIKPSKDPSISKNSITFAMIGTLFLWMFWPSFNAAVFPENQFQKSLVVSNTVLSLTGSCFAAIIMSVIVRKENKVDMEDVLNATLAGGVIIGAPSGLLTNPGGAIAIGFIGGAVSSLCFAKLGPKLKDCLGLDDSCGVHNLHGIPGILGGLFSAIVVAAYQSMPMDANIQGFLSFYETNSDAKSLSSQAGIQVAGTFISLGIGIGAGLVGGFFMRIGTVLQSDQVYDDSVFFEVPDDDHVELNEYKVSGSKVMDSRVSPGKKLLPPIQKPSEIALNTSNG